MTVFQLHHFLHIYQSACVFLCTYEFCGLIIHGFGFQIIPVLADRNPISLPLMALCHDLIALEHILFPGPASYTMLILYAPLPCIINFFEELWFSLVGTAIRNPDLDSRVYFLLGSLIDQSWERMHLWTYKFIYVWTYVCIYTWENKHWRKALKMD